MNKCIVCGIEVLNWKPKYCCSGTIESACGCMGMPIEDCLCSIECENKFYKVADSDNKIETDLKLPF